MKEQDMLKELENMDELDISGLSLTGQYIMLKFYEFLIEEQKREDELLKNNLEK